MFKFSKDNSEKNATQTPDIGKNTSFRFWSMIHVIIRFMISRATYKVVLERTLIMKNGAELRWLKIDIDSFLFGLEPVAARMRDNYPTLNDLKFGNRLLVELTIFTIASFQRLCQLGVNPDCAKEVTADVGWNIYRQLISTYSLPFRLATRNPQRRLSWTVKLLLQFPFSPNEPNGYAVNTWTENGNTFTHFTRCPPQTFVRSISESENDSSLLDAFYQSWCQYDWPGADIIAGDKHRGHYRRTQTLSRGDKCCDMCWMGKAHAVRSK